ncbi:zinc finger protein ZFMSA12A-like [Palaemon carinicauda]|uniref:zinc finger protein ZFMSA12A-like n=1 Tax=Palaemon carinicauda TaxID=392227 RepID=UPI0035B6975A
MEAHCSEELKVPEESRITETENKVEICEGEPSTHVETHSPFCKVHSDSAGQLMTQIKADSSVEPAHCSCNVQISFKAEHVKQMMVHFKKNFKCPKCTCAYSSSLHLARHQQLVHSGKVQCTTNGINPSQSEDLLKIGKECEYCDELVETDAFEHLKIHLQGENECPLCASGFRTYESLKAHMEKHHTQFLQLFLKNETFTKEKAVKSGEVEHRIELCDVCGKAASSSQKLEQHRYSQHPEHYPWSCLECKLSFPSNSDLENHKCHKGILQGRGRQSGNNVKKLKTKTKDQSQHNEKKSDPLKCPVCFVTLKNRKAYCDHVRSHKRQGLKCEFCDVKLKSVANLRAHVSTQHTHSEIHKCKTCSREFFSAGRLSYHLRRHHTDRNTYKNLCYICGKFYPYPSELTLHLRSHLNERPYKCNQCPKTFMKKVDLTYHIRSHTGERPHVCPHCDARFPRPNTLMNHIRQQHQEVARTSTSDASTATDTTTAGKTIRSSSEATIRTPSSNETVVTPSTDIVLTPNNKHNNTLQDQGESVDCVVTVNADTQTGEMQQQCDRSVIPLVEGSLVEAVVDGQVTEMQPIQCVQVEGLAPGQTVQAVQAVPNMMEGIEYDENACASYQIVHLQIL